MNKFVIYLSMYLKPIGKQVAEDSKWFKGLKVFKGLIGFEMFGFLEVIFSE